MSGVGTPRDDIECESGWDEDGTGEDEDTGYVTPYTEAQFESGDGRSWVGTKARDCVRVGGRDFSLPVCSD